MILFLVLWLAFLLSGAILSLYALQTVARALVRRETRRRASR